MSQTLLHLALKSGNTEVVESLTEVGDKLDIHQTRTLGSQRKATRRFWKKYLDESSPKIVWVPAENEGYEEVVELPCFHIEN